MLREFANINIPNNGNVNVLIFKFPVHHYLCDNLYFLHTVDYAITDGKCNTTHIIYYNFTQLYIEIFRFGLRTNVIVGRFSVLSDKTRCNRK